MKNEVGELKTKIDNITSVIRQFEKDKQGCTGGCATSGTHHIKLAARPVINKTIQRTLFNSCKLIDVVENVRAAQLKPGSQPVGDSRPSTDNSGDTQTQFKVAGTTNTPGTETSVNNNTTQGGACAKTEKTEQRVAQAPTQSQSQNDLNI